MFDDPLVATTPDPPSRDGRGVRFGCGLGFGLVAGWCVFVRLFAFRVNIVLILAGVSGLAIGIASAAFGDRFWFSFSTAFRRVFYRGL